MSGTGTVRSRMAPEYGLPTAPGGNASITTARPALATPTNRHTPPTTMLPRASTKTPTGRSRVMPSSLSCGVRTGAALDLALALGLVGPLVLHDIFLRRQPFEHLVELV